ncbi:MAG TPA: hypothetical protein VKE88_00160, partial [Candidatus Nanoarchaeia archaeon]|nr:hypothetical protein [Candidatus Nanoarchaeia archaeon]
MQKEHSLELNKLGWVALGLYLFFQVLYFKDDLVNVVKITAAQLYLFILPGFALMFQFRKKID